MKILFTILAIIVSATFCFGQTSGNNAYSQSSNNARAKQNERSKKNITIPEAPPSASTMFVEANVLLNVKADEYVAVFGIAQECVSVPECNQKMDSVVNEFSEAVRKLGVGRDDLYADYISQNKIYGYKLAGDIAKENLVGFELKKNISIHYKDKQLLDKLILAASQSRIFDLIKVDYIVRDTNAIQERLMEEASKIIKQKTERYQKLLSVKLLAPGQVYAEKPSVYYPTQMYDSYIAEDSEEIVSEYNRQKYTIQNARKGRTFFFNALDADGFDSVINPVVIEPVVQFTLYIKVKYEIDQPKTAK